MLWTSLWSLHPVRARFADCIGCCRFIPTRGRRRAVLSNTSAAIAAAIAAIIAATVVSDTAARGLIQRGARDIPILPSAYARLASRISAIACARP